jgi:hypothetical protein
MVCHWSRVLGREIRRPVSGFLTIRTLFQTMRPNIEFVENQSCTPLRIAVDGRGIPTTATRRTNAFTIEIVSNVARRPTGSIRDEDASHDGRFLLDNLEFPWPAGNRAIAVSPAAGMAAIADYARHSTAHLLGAVFALHLAYKTSDTNQDRAGGAVMDCLDFDPLERKSLVKPC